MKQLTNEILSERLVDVSSMKTEEVEILCWGLQGRFKKIGRKVFIVFTPSDIGGVEYEE